MDFNDLQTRVQEVLANPSLDDLADVDFELGDFILDNKGSPDAREAERLLKQVQTLETQLKQAIGELEKAETKPSNEREQVLDRYVKPILQQVSRVPSEMAPYLSQMPDEVKRVAAGWSEQVTQMLPRDLQPARRSSARASSRRRGSPSSSSSSSSSSARGGTNRQRAPANDSAATDSDTSAGDASPINELLMQAGDAKHKGEWDKAIDLYNQILRLDPRHVEAKEGRDQAVIAKAQGDQVFEQLPSAVKDPFQRAQSRERMGLYKEAEGLYEQARQQALAHGIEHWNELEERFRVIDEALLAQRQIKKADELVKEDKWEEALPLLRNVAKVMGTDEYVEQLKKVQHLKETHDEARQVLRTVERRLRQAAGQPAMIDLIVNDLEDIEAKLGEVLKDYRQSRQLNQLYKELQERIVAVAGNRQERQNKRVRGRVLEGKQLISQADRASDIEQKIRFFQEAVHVLDGIPSDDPTVRQMAREAKNKLNLAERAEQAISEIEDKLLSRRPRDTIEASHQFSEIRPILLRTRKLNDLEGRLVQKIRGDIKLLIKEDEADDALEMIALLEMPTFQRSVRPGEVKKWQARVRAIDPTVVMTDDDDEEEEKTSSDMVRWGLLGFIIVLILVGFLATQVIPAISGSTEPTAVIEAPSNGEEAAVNVETEVAVEPTPASVEPTPVPAEPTPVPQEPTPVPPTTQPAPPPEYGGIEGPDESQWGSYYTYTEPSSTIPATLRIGFINRGDCVWIIENARDDANGEWARIRYGPEWSQAAWIQKHNIRDISTTPCDPS